MERARERTPLSAGFCYRAFNRQWIVTLGKNGTSGHLVLNPLGSKAIVSDR